MNLILNRDLFYTSAPFNTAASVAVYSRGATIPPGAISTMCKLSIMRDFVAFLLLIL